jgi:hypothetical protein
MSLSWVTLASMLLVGILALFSLYSGFQAFGNGELETALYYILMGVSGFAAIGYMLFRSKSGREERLDIKKVDVIVTLECQQCDLKSVREFAKGDYLFKDDEPCTRCEGNATITRIHSRKEKKRAGKKSSKNLTL